MKTLLVPVDFSDSTEDVLAQAAELARQVSGRIVLLHITEPVAEYVPVGASMDVLSAAPPPLEIENIAAQEDRLTGLAKPWKDAGLTVDAVSVVGLAVDDILEQAERQKADYIILGSHGHGALYHLFRAASSPACSSGLLARSS